MTKIISRCLPCLIWFLLFILPGSVLGSSIHEDARIVEAVFQKDSSCQRLLSPVVSSASIYPLPGRIPISLSDTFSRKMFNSLMKTWKAQFSEEDLKPILKRIAHGHSLTSGELALLKSMRKSGNNLKVGYLVLDHNHEAPRKFSNFIRDFGLLNDLLSGGLSQKASHQATKLLRVLKDENLSDLREASLVSPSKIRKFYEDLKKDTLRLLNKNDLTAEEFHTIRKNLKTYSVLCDQVAIGYDRVDARQAQNYLSALIEEMGTIHDQEILESLSGTVNYKTLRIKTPDIIRDEIINFMGRFTLE